MKFCSTVLTTVAVLGISGIEIETSNAQVSSELNQQQSVVTYSNNFNILANSGVLEI